MIGRTVSHYVIESEIGAGGMGVVYRATDKRLGRTVALKFLPPDLTRSADAKERFIREAQSASSLDHPNICTIYAFDETEDHQLFFAMAFYEGETLKARLRRGPLPIAEACEFAMQIARGLGNAHQRGIVHRDIKPANVMITPAGEVKILDFGLAKLANDRTLTREGTTVGSPTYMSPEQVRGERVDRRTDIWSLGALLYEMITGRPPFRGETDRAVFHGILESEFEPTGKWAIDSIIHKALAKSVDERYQDTSEFHDALRNAASEIEGSTSATAIRGEEAKTNALPSIAVLPFLDMSPGSDQDYFCQGIAEEILNSLTQITGLRVASRTSSFLFKGSDQDIRKIGERLKVNTILEGSVRKSGERLRVTVQLINVADGYHLWSHRYDSELKDVFQIQDEIAENAARMLEPLLRTGVRKTRRTGMAAYDYYLRGRKLYELRAKGLQLAREMFERSAECDPDYALAWTGIADCSAWLFLWFTGDAADLRKAEEASRRAVELSPDLAEAHVSRGLALSAAKRYDDAAAEYEKAIQLNPNLFDAWFFYGRARFSQNRPEDALRLFLRAAEVQPDDYQAILIAAMSYQKIGETEKAMAARQELLRRVERRLLIDPHDARAMYLGAHSLVATGGDRQRADEWIRRALEEDPEDQVALYSVSCFYALIGDKDKALEFLDKLTSGRHGVFRDWVDNDPDLNSMRSDPRFQEVVSRLR